MSLMILNLVNLIIEQKCINQHKYLHNSRFIFRSVVQKQHLKLPSCFFFPLAGVYCRKNITGSLFPITSSPCACVCKSTDLCVVQPNTGELRQTSQCQSSDTRLGCFYSILCNTLFMPNSNSGLNLGEREYATAS